ncbi:RHS repeat-associated core domain-containing protein [Fluviicola taffensis]|uniref:RHS repeat-associated core domain-containing protein n=1 Tax=Fluviicola taffensis TaxID=191579 RepID=UPI003137B670
MFVLRFIPLLVLFFASLNATAALVPHTAVVLTGSTASGTTSITPPGWSLTPTVDLTRKGVITFGVDHHYSSYVSQSTTEITVFVEKFSTYSATTPTSTETKIMTVYYYPVDSLSYVDENTLTIDNVEKVKVTITQIKVNGVIQTTLPANLYLQADVFVDRIYDFASQVTFNSYHLLADHPFDVDCDGVDDEITVSWDAVPGAEEYQLEWTFINTVGLTTTEINNLKVDFKNNSTRISTIDLSYKISLLFDRGIVAFRVRAVGRSSTSPYNLLFSAWSILDGPQVMSTISTDAKQNVDPYDVKKNWQYSATYAEEGKKKEVVSFYDGSLRNRQMVTKISTDHNAIVGETIYDHQGRPAIQILPVPVTDPADCEVPDTENSLKFYPEFNKNEAGTTSYSKIDFDLSDPGDSCHAMEINPMSSSAGASKYYSTNNTDNSGSQGYVPDAHGYPFSQVEYTPDNTGRIRRQGGVGKDFQLEADVTTHPTEYYYSHPFQEQLDRLFGSEVGDAAHYQKNMVVDPNGQVSVSYLDQEGRVIATSLAGEEHGNLVALPSAGTSAPLSVDLFAKDANGNSTANKLSFDGMAKEFSQTVSLSSSSTLTIRYDIAVNRFTSPCLGSLCLNCVYDLSIEVRNLCGELESPVAMSSKMVGRFTEGPGGAITFLTDCQDYNYTNTFVTDALPVGTYQITKTLTVNQEALETYLQMYTDTSSLGINTCIDQYDDILDQVGASSNIDDCSEDFSCAQCVTNLGSLLEYITAGGTEEQYNYELEQCNAPCKGASYYENMRAILMMDVTPDGQYGQYLNNQNVIDVTIYPLSVLNATATNKLPKVNANWRNPRYDAESVIQNYYFDEDGVTRSRIPLTNVVFTGVSPGATPALLTTPVLGTNVFLDNATGNYYTYPQFLNSVSDFISYYSVNPQWANSLVYYHPEYPYLTKYKEYYVKANPADPYSSESFEQYMMTFNTWDDAKIAGFITSTTPLSGVAVNNRINHFWDTPAGSPGAFLRDPYGLVTAALNTKIMNYATINGTNYSMMQVAAMMNRGGNNLVGTVPTSTDLDLGIDVAGYSTLQNTQLRDAEWMTFRGLYLAAKQELQYTAARTYAINTDPGYNGCIGNSSFSAFDYGFLVVAPATTPFFSGGFFNSNQPCSIYTLGYYTHKQPRFGNQLVNVNSDPSQVAYQMYLQTGQCPIASAFQRFLSEAASDHNLANTGFSATNTMNSLSGLIMAMQNFEIPTSIPSLTWTVLTGNNTSSSLQLALEETSSTFATFSLSKALGSATYAWSDVVSFNNLQFTVLTGSLYEFTVDVKVSIGGNFVIQHLTGTTTFKIGNCSFPDVCKLNDFGKTLQNLTKSLAQMGTLSSTSYIDLTAIPYSNFLNNAVKYTVNPTYAGAAIKWKYDAAIPGFVLTDATRTINIKITGTNPSTFSLSSLSTIAFIDELKAGANNTMELVCKNSLNTYLVTLSCELIRSDNIAIPVGKCGLDEAIICTGLEYETYDDLMAVLEFSLENQNEPFSLYNTPLWTSVLNEQLVSTPTTIIGDVDNPTGDILTYDLPGSCDLVLTYNGSSPNFNFNNIVSVNDIKLLNQTVYGSFNDFKLYVTYSYGGNFYQDSILGTSCFKLKTCETCTRTPNDTEEVHPATSEQTDGVVDLSTLNEELITEIDNDSELYCLDLYEDYLALINNKVEEMMHAGCISVTINEPILTYEQFVTYGYCCEDNFYGVVNYFNDLYSLNTSGCSIDANFDADGLGEITTCTIPDWQNAGSSFCIEVYVQYVALIGYFNNSAWASANGVHLDVASSSAFKCRCFANYAFYLLEYISALADEKLSHPMSISDYCGLMDAEPTNTCSTQYDQYVSCTNYFNDNSGATALPIVDYDVFVENDLCYCVDDYCSSLSLTLNHLQEDEQTDLLVFCLSGREVPCVTDTVATNFETFEIAFEDPCTAFYASNNEVNAQIHYNQQIQDFYTQLGQDYIAHCMKATEGLSLSYNEIEHHFTLYYYDQAGNLIKTIPPEGVEFVDISDPTIKTGIKADRLNNTHKVITNHRMATTYLYNSLNQLVAQNMPDQDAIKVFEPILPNGLPVALTTTGIQMIDANQGYLTGFMDATGVAPLTNRGYLFKTTNGGLNWVRITNTLGTDLKEVQMVSTTAGYAMSLEGLNLITKDGGLNWDLLDMSPGPIPNYGEYVAMEVVGVNAYILNRNGRIFKVTPAGVVSVYLNALGSIPGYTVSTVKDFTLQGNVTDFKGILYLLTVSDGVETFDATFISTVTTGGGLKIDKVQVGDLNALSFYSTTAGFIGGADGNLSRVDGTAASSYRQRLQKSDAKGLIDQIHMLNATIGIARITENGVKVIRRTTDGGATWIPLLKEYTNATLSLNRRSASNLEVLIQGYEGAPSPAPAAYSTNVVLNTGGLCSELNQNPSLAQNLDMKIVSTYNDGTNLTYYGIAFDGTNYNLYKSNTFINIGTNVSYTLMAILGNSTVIPKEMVVAKSGTEIAVEVLTTGGVIYRSQSTTTGSVITFPTFTNSAALTSIVSIDKITISSLDYMLVYRSSDNKVYLKAATSSGSYSAYVTNLTLSGSVITKMAVHGSYITLAGTNGGIFTVAGVTATAGSTLSFGSRSNHQLYNLKALKYTPTMNLVVGENGQALTRPVLLTSESVATLRPLGLTSDLNAMGEVNYASAVHYIFGGNDGALAVVRATNWLLAPTLYTTSGTSVTDHIGGKKINDISTVTISNVTKVFIVGDMGSLYYTPNIYTESFLPAVIQSNQNFLGVSIITTTEKAMVVGTGTEVFRYNLNVGTRITRVFGPKYKDVHFENSQIGTLIGDYYFVRSTINGGLNWKLNRVTVPNTTGLTKVWTKSKPNGEHFAFVGAVGYIIKLDNGTVTQTVTSGTIDDIQFSKSDPLFGYIANNNTLARVSLMPIGTAPAVTYNISTPATVYTAANPIRGIHVFENTSAIMVGDAGGIYYYRNDPTTPTSYTLATVSGVAFKDVAFIDDKVGLAVGDAGTIYSLYSTNNDNVTHDILTTGFSASPESYTDPESGVTPALFNITALAFSSTNTAVYGGGFISSGDITTRGAMVRYLKFEKELYSARFYYDRLGRIVASQNSRQAGVSGITDDKYSYTLYDGLGRVTEAGEKSENGSGGTKFASVFGTNVGGTIVPSVVDDANLGTWLLYDATNTRKEVTKSYYDITDGPINTDLGFTSTTLDKSTQRKRIVHVTYSSVYSTSSNVYDHATHYDYDIHGNVRTLYQDNRLISTMSGIGDHRLKKLDYIYDLISGNVHRVDYQSGQSDQWHHAYNYDADNRITDAYTTLETPLTVVSSSLASIQDELEWSTLWDREVNYQYYEHGPLARTVLGDQEVQGIDNVYTLQGWIKGVNSNTLDANRDPGMDGASLSDNHTIARDVFGYSLHYFDGDYGGAIGGNNTFIATQTATNGIVTNSSQLYNGNIGRMVTTITNPDTRAVLPVGNAYKYDQLNRLSESKSFNNIDLGANSWNTGGTTMYYNKFTYDANGNIMTQLRYDETATGIIDQLSYNYKDVAGGIGTTNPKKHNRLYNVQDGPTYNYDANDIDPGQATNNYAYDAEGRLVSDAQEKIAVISWRVDGKVKKISRNTGFGKKNISFDYDAMGHRIAKHVYTDADVLERSTYYVLDAQGNTMSVYERTIVDNGTRNGLVTFAQTEKHIYGSSRLGVHTERIELLGTLNDTYSMANIHHHLGNKTYELTNHLGNVLSVISDKVIPHNNGGTIDYWLADLRQATDYSPFGVMLHNRDLKLTSTSGIFAPYRYSFNGMEKDDEVKGGGNSYTTEFRQYDPRLGRWLTIDPLSQNFPWQSPYVAFDNKPIVMDDPKGLAANGTTGNGGYQKGDKGSRKKDNGNGTSNYDAPVGTVILPQRAKVLETLQDGNGNGKVDYNGKTLEGEFGDLNKFELDGVVYTSKYSSGKFMGFYSGKGEKYSEGTIKPIAVEQDLEFRVQAGSSSVGVGAMGAELDLLGWQYYSVSSKTGEGWDEGGKSTKMHDFSFFEPGSGVSVKPGFGVEILSIGGGTLTVEKAYLKKHPTKSIVKLLNDKNIITISAGWGYKYARIEIFTDDLELIATGNIHSFTVCSPGGGVRQGKTSFY